VPRFVELWRLPAEPAPLADVLTMLAELDPPDLPPEQQALLEVRVRLLQPEPDHGRQIRAALEGKPVRLLRIDAHAAVAVDSDAEAAGSDSLEPAALDPETVLRDLYLSRYGEALPEELAGLLLELLRSETDETA
jgi:exonuclease SbcD